MPYSTVTVTAVATVVTVTGATGEPVKNCARLPSVIVHWNGAMLQLPFTRVIVKFDCPLPFTTGVSVPEPTPGPSGVGLFVQVRVLTPMAAPVITQAEGVCVDPL